MTTTGGRRKAIPVKIKLKVLINQARCKACGEKLGSLTDTQFDHRPSLEARTYDEGIGDFVPPQLDPDAIEAVHADCHLQRTSGRKAGAAKTVSTRDSDVGEAARSRSIAAAHEDFRRRVRTKEPGQSARPTSRWPKRKLRGGSRWTRSSSAAG